MFIHLDHGRGLSLISCVSDERDETEDGQAALRDHRRLLLPGGSHRKAGYEPGHRVEGPEKCSGAGENLVRNAVL